MLISAGFVVVLAGLAWSRLAGLDQSLWRDEMFTVVHYVRPGPEGIFLGEYHPNNHMLFSLMTWLTSMPFGDSEQVLRLWSVFPFLVGVGLGTGWLFRREGAGVALLYLFLATQSPLLLDLSTQARGYGLAFLAMSVLTIAACEAYRSESRLPVLAFCAAGVAGTWTLPVFGVAFGATSLVLLAQPSVRRKLLPWLAVSGVAILGWYLRVLGDLASSSGQEYGEQLAWHAGVTAPISQLLHPSFSPHEEPVLAAYLLFGVLLAAGIHSALVRSRSTAAVLLSGVVGTYVVLSIGRFYIEPRFVSYLLHPLSTLLALGLAASLRFVLDARMPVRVLAGAAWALFVTWLAVVFLAWAIPSTRLPIEANREAAAVVDGLPPGSRVVVNLWIPDSLRFYLKRPIVVPSAERIQEVVCRRDERGLVYVGSEYRTHAVDLSCLEQAGATRQRFEQRDFAQRHRGRWIDVWFLPGSAP